jgi:hypothetical protein
MLLSWRVSSGYDADDCVSVPTVKPSRYGGSEPTGGCGMNEDHHRPPTPVAAWFKWAALATLAWMLLGVVNYLWQVTLDPATLPPDQQTFVAAVPDWMLSFFALAVWIGLAGAVLLVLRRKAAEPLLLGSLVACLIQFTAYFVHAPLREAMPRYGLVNPVLILAITWTIYWFARRSRQRGWLR